MSGKRVAILEVGFSGCSSAYTFPSWDTASHFEWDEGVVEELLAEGQGHSQILS